MSLRFSSPLLKIRKPQGIANLARHRALDIRNLLSFKEVNVGIRNTTLSIKYIWRRKISNLKFLKVVCFLIYKGTKMSYIKGQVTIHF